MEKAPPLTEEEKKEAKKSFLIANGLVLSAIAVISIVASLCLTGTINLAGRTTSISSYGERLEFSVKYMTPSVFFLVLLVFNVIIQRMKTGALDPLAGRDCYFKRQSNILQNTFEQFVLTAFAQICLVAFMDGEWTMRVIPCVNFLFVFGRIAFVLGYPKYRAFGMFCGLLPTFVMIATGLYKLLEHLFL